MAELLRTWWPVMVLVWLPSLVQSVVSVWIARAFRQLDESHPDDMAMTAGEWLDHEITRLGLKDKLQAIVTDSDAKASLDAYHVHHGVIQLKAETYFKRDPMHWAIAAHELGHARFKLAFPLLGRCLIAANFIKKELVGFGLALVVGNVLFALPGVTDFAKHLFELALALHSLELVDEFVASSLAVRSLRVSQHVQMFQMSNARRALRLAFSTYAIAFATYAALFTQWHLVADQTRVPAVPPIYSLTPLGNVVAWLCTGIGVAFAFVQLRAAFRNRPVRSPRAAFVWLLFQVALIGFVWLVWNQRADVRWAYFVIGALFLIAGYLTLLLWLPGMLLNMLVLGRLTRRFTVDATHRTPELERDHRAGHGRRRDGNAAFSSLLEKTIETTMLETRVGELLKLSYLPLVVAFWMS